MLDWIRLLVAIPGCMVAAMKLYALLRRFLHSRSPQPIPSLDIVLSLSMIGTLIFAGIGWRETRRIEKQLQECQARPLIGFGTQNDRFWAQVNTQALEIRAEGKPANAVFVARLADKTIDENTDRTLLKSHLVPIPDEVLTTRNMEVVLPKEILQRFPVAAGLMDARLYLLPTDVSRDMISCLADIKAHHGRMIAGGWYTIPHTVTPILNAHQNEVPEAH